MILGPHVVVQNRDGVVIAVAGCLEKALAYEPGAWVGEPAAARVPEALRAQYAQHVEAARRGSAVTHDIPRLDAEGQPWATRARMEPLRAADGSIGGVIETIELQAGERARRDGPTNGEHDQTPRQAEVHPATAAAALVDDEWFAKAFRLIPTGAGLLSLPEWRFVDVNDAYLETTGLVREQVVGRLLFEMPRPVGTARVDVTQRFLAGDVVRKVAHRFTRRDGMIGEAFISLERLVRGGSEYVLVVIDDVTDRVRVEAALEESERHFQQLAEAIHEVFWLSNPEKNQILYVSPGYEAIWGRTCASLYATPRDWLDAIHSADRERVMAAALAKQVLGTYDEEYRIVRPDGEVRWIRDRAFPVRDDSGQVLRIAGVAEDVTDRRSLEAQLRQTQKLESIGRLAAGVAHDFNNLLTVISACSEELLATLPGAAPEREALQEIAVAVDRASGLTRDLLAFGRREIHEPAVLDLNAVVRGTERILRRLMGEDIALTLALEAKPLLVRIDPSHWSSLLVNLAVNARDAMPSGGRLSFHTRSASLSENEARPLGLSPGPHAVLEVVDDGVGFASDVQSRLFEPFFTTKPPGMGTGLGLAVVHGIVKQSGGEIEASSQPGNGATFRIFLPASKEIARTDARSAAPPDTGTGLVLLVEDDDAIRRVATRVLRSAGFEVIHAADATEALAHVAARGAELRSVVTDVVLPGMDGRRLAEEIHRRYPKVPVLYTSGYTDDEVIRRGISKAEVAFLAKPYSPKTLVARVHELLATPSP